MRNLEDIEKDLAAAREALSSVEGTPAEVYSRIVGYYRSVRNWNRGKREEYGERRLYLVPDIKMSDAMSGTASGTSSAATPSPTPTQRAEPALVMPIQAGKPISAQEDRLLLFVRASCPGCAAAKAAAGRLGIPVDLVSADTADGMAEAVKRNVLSTPTAILLSPEGEELGRARDAETIGRLLNPAHSIHTEPIAV